jgi:hypothetical protein
MCNCGKRRVATAAPAGGGAPRTGGCVGPGCPPGVLAQPVVPPVPAPRAAPGSIPLSYRRRQGAPVVVPSRTAVAPPTPAATPAEPEPIDVGLPIVDPVLWGPHLWRFLHVTAALPAPRLRGRDKWRALLEALRVSLPCPECTGHYQAWHRTHPFRAMLGGVAVRRAAMRWVLDLHNDVNRRRGVAVWSQAQMEASVAGLGVADARAALEAAIAAGVGPGLRGAAEVLLV